MNLAALQFSAHAHQEDRAVAADRTVLSLFRAEGGILVFQFLCGDKGNLIREFRLDERIMRADIAFGLAQRHIDIAHDFPERFLIALIRSQNALPVPLVHKDGMDVVCFLIAPDGVHIGIQTFAHGKAVVLQRHTFPFGQGMHDFHRFSRFKHVESHRTLHTVEVVVQTALGRDHNRG